MGPGEREMRAMTPASPTEEGRMSADVQALITAVATFLLLVLPIIFGVTMVKHREAIGE